MKFDQGTPARLADSLPLGTPDVVKILFTLGDYTKRTGAISGLNFEGNLVSIISTNNNGIDTPHTFDYVRLNPGDQPQRLQNGVLYDILLSEETQLMLQVGANRTEISVRVGIKETSLTMFDGNASGPITSYEWVFFVNGAHTYAGVIPIGRDSSGIFATENRMDSTAASIARTVALDESVSRFHAVALIALDQQHNPHLLVIDTSTNGTRVAFSPQQPV